MDEKTKHRFLKLTREQQKEVILGLQLLERDGVIQPPLSPKFLAVLESETERTQ